MHSPLKLQAHRSLETAQLRRHTPIGTTAKADVGIDLVRDKRSFDYGVS
jgi:hypothetical protein